MSSFGGKADMTVCGCPLLRSLLGVKRTWLFAAHMSAYDPKRTSGGAFPGGGLNRYDACPEPQGANDEAARVHFIDWRGGGSMAADCARTAIRFSATHSCHYGFSRRRSPCTTLRTGTAPEA